LTVRKTVAAAPAYDGGDARRDLSPPAKPIPFIVLQEPAGGAAQRRGFALWQLGFRPFYLLAGIFGALSIALWAAQFAGVLGATYLPGPAWQAHEMLFGFALAVIVGFLFTAATGRASQRRTARRSPRSPRSGSPRAASR